MAGLYASSIVGVVLAGGRSRRFGSDKARYPLAGRRMVERVLITMGSVLERVVVIANDPTGLEGIEVFSDRVPDCGPMGGLYTAFLETGAERCLLTACDTPLVESAVLKLLVRHLSFKSADAVVPWVSGLPQPLLAGYSSNCFPVLERRIHRRQLKMVDLLPEVQVDCVPADEIYAEGGSPWSFFNVNTRDDLELAEAYLRGEFQGAPPGKRGGGR